MKLIAAIGGRPVKGDSRDLSFWVGDLKLKADGDFDPYVLAAVWNALHGRNDELYKAIEESAKKLLFIHADRVNATKKQKGGDA